MRGRSFLSLALAASLSACAPHPEKACVSPRAQETALRLLFDNAEAVVEEAITFTPSSPFQKADVIAKIEQLKREHFIRYEFVVLDGYEKSIQRVTCSAKLDFILNADDQSQSAQAALAPIELNGLDPPSGLYGKAPSAMFAFTSQPSSAKDDTIIASDQRLEAVSAILAVAMSRAIRQTHPASAPATRTP
jgi:hypothetical protein